MTQVLRLDTAELPRQTWDDPARGTLTWQPLLSKGLTPTDALVCGVAEVLPGQHLAAHHHPQPEVYFGISGQGEIVVNGQTYLLAPGVALFIPGGAEHGVPAVDQPLRWFYTFACDSFDQIAYQFSHEDAALAPGPRQP